VICYYYSMLRRRVVAAALTLAALAAPGSALAQSAGGDQYQDPLAGNPGSGSSNPTTPSTPSASPTSSSGSTAATSTTASAAQSGTARSGELPRTGFDVFVVAWLGLGMLLTGVTLRRWLVLQTRRT
jgi:hypothetical protein